MVLPVKDHIAVLHNGEAHNQHCVKYSEEEFGLPDWFDEEKYKRGQKYIRENVFSQFTCTLSGLICVLSIPTILDVLVNSQRSSTVITAYRRYISTIFHTFSWYNDELKPGSKSWNSLATVRTRHFRSSMISNSKGYGHISQRDMVFTQYGFFGLGLLCPDKLGMVCGNIDDIEGYTHFWRTIGYMIGIDDKYNLARPSLEETKQVCEYIRNEVYAVHLRNPPEYFHYMIKVLIDAMWFYSPSLREGSFLYFTFWLAGIEGYKFDFKMTKFEIKLVGDSLGSKNVNNNCVTNGDAQSETLTKELGWYNKYLLRILMTLHTSWLTTAFGRMYLNGQTYVTIFLLTYFPFLSIWYFGFKNAFVNMFAEDIAIQAQPLPNRKMFLLKNY
ncbi:uncharacterized protein LOC143918220 isoform X2 [Arctopsyche grandis]|uniref:uncharacterized protein LOC143918220 isoform X2 n=1 Tax=Arctopsyche grandis TaxID=121162 RepID=UPI00406D7E39